MTAFFGPGTEAGVEIETKTCCKKEVSPLWTGICTGTNVGFPPEKARCGSEGEEAVARSGAGWLPGVPTPLGGSRPIGTESHSGWPLFWV